jgi:RNA polymerase sigma-70 factor (ECF subfamily)
MRNSAQSQTSSDEEQSDAALLTAARLGSREAQGELLNAFRRYLLSIAAEELDYEIRSKAGASDLVQETCLEAHRDFAQFSGRTRDDLRSWLRRILKNNLANLRRSFLGAARRSVRREVSLNAGPERGGLRRLLPAGSTSPSRKAIYREQQQQLQQALARLPSDYQQVLTLRHREGRTFQEIGTVMGRSPDAARMLWWRAFERLADLLESGTAV